MKLNEISDRDYLDFWLRLGLPAGMAISIIFVPGNAPAKFMGGLFISQIPIGMAQIGLWTENRETRRKMRDSILEHEYRKSQWK